MFHFSRTRDLLFLKKKLSLIQAFDVLSSFFLLLNKSSLSWSFESRGFYFGASLTEIDSQFSISTKAVYGPFVVHEIH